MSRDVASAGMMVPLCRVLTREEREEWQEILWEQNSIVHINYEGTLAYTDEGGAEYGITFGHMEDYSLEPFKVLDQFGIYVLDGLARPYHCRWYNGADSDMDMMKLKDFLERIKQNG